MIIFGDRLKIVDCVGEVEIWPYPLTVAVAVNTGRRGRGNR